MHKRLSLLVTAFATVLVSSTAMACENGAVNSEVRLGCPPAEPGTYSLIAGIDAHAASEDNVIPLLPRGAEPIGRYATSEFHPLSPKPGPWQRALEEARFPELPQGPDGPVRNPWSPGGTLGARTVDGASPGSGLIYYNPSVSGSIAAGQGWPPGGGAPILKDKGPGKGSVADTFISTSYLPEPPQGPDGPVRNPWSPGGTLEARTVDGASPGSGLIYYNPSVSGSVSASRIGQTTFYGLKGGGGPVTPYPLGPPRPRSGLFRDAVGVTFNLPGVGLSRTMSIDSVIHAHFNVGSDVANALEGGSVDSTGSRVFGLD